MIKDEFVKPQGECKHKCWLEDEANTELSSQLEARALLELGNKQQEISVCEKKYAQVKMENRVLNERNVTLQTEIARLKTEISSMKSEAVLDRTRLEQANAARLELQSTLVKGICSFWELMLN
jgi:hypothetical protein